MENHEKTLTESISDAKMEFERLQALLSEKEAEMKREEILKKHTTPITFLEGRGRWTTRVNGKQKTLKSRKELEDWIVSQYSETATAKTLDDIAEAWFSIDEKRIHLITNIDDLKTIDPTKKYVMTNQTTMSLYDVYDLCD